MKRVIFLLAMILSFFNQNALCLNKFCIINNIKYENNHISENNNSFSYFDNPVLANKYVKQDTSNNGTSYKKVKNPYVAGTLSLVPGFFIHGIGHVYIGYYKTAAVIFSLECLSVYVGFASALSGIDGGNDETINEIVTFSTIAFLGTWIYDIVVTQVICHRLNEKAKKAILHPFIQKNQYGDQYTGIRLSIKF